MIAKCHLVLLLSFVQVTINHLKNSVFRINLSIVVLLIDLDFFLELFCLRNSHDLSPMCEDLHSVEVCHLLLLVHRILQVVTPDLHLLLLLVQVLNTFVLITDLDERALLICCGRL